ncbi:MAG TPA: Sua5/YciO/YrdC/YwlC family protein [Phycisphaerae bacterium]|nr:Sua5/YciO/YrdC/YwlC family protein [Phycisphaerae bacterium]
MNEEACLQISADQPDAADRAAAVLRSGRLVGLPMETVYGIAATVNLPDAIKKLKAAVGVSGHPSWVLHLADPQDLKQYVAQIPPLAGRLINKLWPGPVAVRLHAEAADVTNLQKRVGEKIAGELLEKDFLSFRCPQHALTQEIIRRTNSPVVIYGASKTRLITTATEIPREVMDHLALVIDGGPTRYGRASTLIQVDEKGVKVLREGVVAERTIRRLADFVILFICTGNTCRSPMAVGLAANILAKKLGIDPDDLHRRHIVIESAGLAASHGLSASPEAVQAAMELGADISRHRSRSVTEDLLRRADVIYTMTRAHRAGVVAHSPEASDKAQVLDPQGDIADPIGGGIDLYRNVAERINEVLRQRMSEVNP